MMQETVYSTFPILTTSRLLLRALHIQDTDAVFALGADDRVMQWYDLDTFTAKEDAHAFILRQQQRFADQRGIRWGIVLRETNQIIGWCGHVQGPAQRVELGYVLAPTYWRHGYMREALRTICRFTFTQMRVNRLEATVHITNVASRRLLETLHFQAEGTLRDYGYWRGSFQTLVMYALLREDLLTISWLMADQ